MQTKNKILGHREGERERDREREKESWQKERD
jgi:hypothetical protein